MKENQTIEQGAQPAAPCINLLGVPVSALNLESAVELISSAIAQRVTGYVCVTGAHGVVTSQRDESLQHAYDRAFLVVPDGMPLVWELRRQGHGQAGRVYGPDLMVAMLQAGGRHYLYGATAETLSTLKRRIERDYPQAQIVGCHAPPFRPLTAEEEAEDAARIDAAAPDVVWVGIGAPKQERWMMRMRARLQAPMLIGVGAAFDFHAGKLRQAPRWMQSAGLEWLFRLAMEPRRLWRRYLKVVPTYLWLLALQRSGLRTFSLRRPNRTSDPARTCDTR